MVVSSACWWEGGAGRPSGMRMASILPAACSCRSRVVSGWTAATYSRGKRGLPWAAPDCTAKLRKSQLPKRTIARVPSSMRLIHRSMPLPNPIC